MENQRVPCGSGIVGSDQKVAVPLEGSVWCAIYVFAQGGRLVGPVQGRSGRGVGLLGGIMAQDKLLWCCVPASGSHGFDLPEAGADLATTQRDGRLGVVSRGVDSLPGDAMLRGACSASASGWCCSCRTGRALQRVAIRRSRRQQTSRPELHCASPCLQPQASGARRMEKKPVDLDTAPIADARSRSTAG